MSTVQTIKRQLQKIKSVHAFIAPIVIIPIILTLTTGSIFQAYELLGKEDSAGWLLEIHKGNFGPIHLDVVYPFLNALGLLFMAITGGSMWLKLRRINEHGNSAS